MDHAVGDVVLPAGTVGNNDNAAGVGHARGYDPLIQSISGRQSLDYRIQVPQGVAPEEQRQRVTARGRMSDPADWHRVAGQIGTAVWGHEVNRIYLEYRYLPVASRDQLLVAVAVDVIHSAHERFH